MQLGKLIPKSLNYIAFVATFWSKTSSVQFSCSVVSDSLRPHEPQNARPRCPSPTPGVHPNPCPSGWWCHATISSSVIPFSSCFQSFPASGSFPKDLLLPALYMFMCVCVCFPCTSSVRFCLLRWLCSKFCIPFT